MVSNIYTCIHCDGPFGIPTHSCITYVFFTYVNKYFQSTCSQCKLCTCSPNIISSLDDSNSYSYGMTLIIVAPLSEQKQLLDRLWCQAPGAHGSPNWDLRFCICTRYTKEHNEGCNLDNGKLSMIIGNAHACSQINSGEFIQNWFLLSQLYWCMLL